MVTLMTENMMVSHSDQRATGSAKVGLAGSQLRDGQLDPGTASRAALGSCQLALEAADLPPWKRQA